MIAEVQGALDQAMAPSAVQAQALARRWMRLLDHSTGSDIGLAIKLQTMQENESRAQQFSGITPPMMAWILAAFAGARIALLAHHLAPAECEQVGRRMLAHGPAWQPLMRELHGQMDAGAGCDDPAVQALALRWEALFRASYCGADAALEAKVRAAFHAEPDLSLGVDAGLIAFVQRAILRLPGAGEENEADGTAAGPKPSAQMVAVLRAAHQLLDAPLVFDDPLALKILGPAGEAAVRAGAARYTDTLSTALRSTLVVRSRLAEDTWAAAERAGVRQYVLLGAGLDTYACRAARRGRTAVFSRSTWATPSSGNAPACARPASWSRPG